MSATRLNLEICSHTLYFARKFRCRAFTDDYLFYEYINQGVYKSLAIIKTSNHCYRLIYYSSLMMGPKKSEYKSFRTFADMCVYLDSICPSAVENK